jgi:hypothetical protein
VAGVCKQLIRKGLGTSCRFQDFLHVFAHFGTGLEPLQNEVSEVRDDGQEVVEIMGNAAR